MSGEAIGLLWFAAAAVAIAFLIWACCVSKLSTSLSIAVLIDSAMGTLGLVYFLWVDRLVGAIFVAASVVGGCVVSSALWIRPIPETAPEAGSSTEVK